MCCCTPLICSDDCPGARFYIWHQMKRIGARGQTRALFTGERSCFHGGGKCRRRRGEESAERGGASSAARRFAYGGICLVASHCSTVRLCVVQPDLRLCPSRPQGRAAEEGRNNTWMSTRPAPPTCHSDFSAIFPAGATVSLHCDRAQIVRCSKPVITWFSVFHRRLGQPTATFLTVVLLTLAQSTLRKLPRLL